MAKKGRSKKRSYVIEVYDDKTGQLRDVIPVMGGKKVTLTTANSFWQSTEELGLKDEEYILREKSHDNHNHPFYQRESAKNKLIPAVAASRAVKAYSRKKRLNEAKSFKGMAIVDELGNVIQIISPSPGRNPSKKMKKYGDAMDYERYSPMLDKMRMTGNERPSLEIARQEKRNLQMMRPEIYDPRVAHFEDLKELKIKPITVYQNKDGAWIDYELGRRTYNRRNWVKQGDNKVLKNPIAVPNTSLRITAVGMDRNGNSTIRLKPVGGGKAFSIQTNNRAMQEVHRIKSNIPDGRFITREAGDQIRNYIARYGTESQKAKAFRGMMRGKSSYQKY